MKTNRIIDAIVSFGAVIVIFGAWAKLLHKDGADMFLTIGLLTECLIFAIYGFIAIFGKQPPSEAQPQFISDKLQPEDKELKETMKSIDDTLKKVFRV